MPRNMSFALTTEQFKDRSKTVTRRKGWVFLKPGDLVMGCVKCMGLKPGEKIQRLGLIQVVDVRREPLFEITTADCWREGFPDLYPHQFIEMFCSEMGGDNQQVVTRIEYEYARANRKPESNDE